MLLIYIYIYIVILFKQHKLITVKLYHFIHNQTSLTTQSNISLQYTTSNIRKRAIKYTNMKYEMNKSIKKV